MSRRLIVNNGQRELVLVGNLVVGRDPMCDISDADSLLSRRHAEFIVNLERVSVRDLGSRNGVFVNGKRVAEGPLRPGDVVQIGHLRLQYVEDQTPFAAVVVDDDDVVDPDSTNVFLPPHTTRPDASALASTVALPVMRPPAPARDTSTPFDSTRTLDAGDMAAGRIAYGAPAARPAPLATVSFDTPPAGVAPQARASHAKGSWNTFVFTRVAVLAALVLVSSLIPVFMQRGTTVGEGGDIWLALPILVALIATYGIGALISGRTIQALTTLHEEVELAASGNLEAVSDPLGAKPTQDLANTLNRMIARLRSEAARPRNV